MPTAIDPSRTTQPASTVSSQTVPLDSRVRLLEQATDGDGRVRFTEDTTDRVTEQGEGIDSTRDDAAASDSPLGLLIQPWSRATGDSGKLTPLGPGAKSLRGLPPKIQPEAAHSTVLSTTTTTTTTMAMATAKVTAAATANVTPKATLTPQATDAPRLEPTDRRATSRVLPPTPQGVTAQPAARGAQPGAQVQVDAPAIEPTAPTALPHRGDADSGVARSNEPGLEAPEHSPPLPAGVQGSVQAGIGPAKHTPDGASPMQAAPRPQPPVPKAEHAAAPKPTQMTYAFKSWGDGHATTVQFAPTGGLVTMNPTSQRVSTALLTAVGQDPLRMVVESVDESLKEDSPGNKRGRR